MKQLEKDELEIFSMQGLDYASEAIKKLLQYIVILEDERDEYRRKYLYERDINISRKDN